jgi:aspartate aminotransferase
MLNTLEQIPVDPILGIIEAHRDDPNPKKIDLGVGVYKNEGGHTPILRAVKKAESIRLNTETSKTYLGPPGVAGFNTAMTGQIFGEQHPAVADGRVRTVQTPGGTAALRVAAELVRRANPDSGVWCSDPTWANHLALFPAAGLALHDYPYFDREQSSLRFDEMMQALAQRGPGDVVVFHACCHNPCGVDLEPEHWQAVVELTRDRGFLPLIDIAYQGFGDSIEEDALGVRLLANAEPEMIVASSCSKNFGLYRERVGAVSILAETADKAAAVESNIHTVTRGLYSMPPAHGPAIVDIILKSPELTALWLEELAEMRQRIAGLRQLLVETIVARGISRDFSFIERQRGMFSFLGITIEQVHRLRDEHSIYMVDSARINIAGFSHANIGTFVDALAEVL